MPVFAIDRKLNPDARVRVHLETITTYRTRSGRPGKKQRWVAEVGEPSDTWSLIGRGRTIKAAIANLGPRAYEMDFDSIAWRMRSMMPADINTDPDRSIAGPIIDAAASEMADLAEAAGLNPEGGPGDRHTHSC
jgi:hypothetical protein